MFNKQGKVRVFFQKRRCISKVWATLGCFWYFPHSSNLHFLPETFPEKTVLGMELFSCRDLGYIPKSYYFLREASIRGLHGRCVGWHDHSTVLSLSPSAPQTGFMVKKKFHPPEMMQRAKLLLWGMAWPLGPIAEGFPPEKKQNHAIHKQFV